MTIRLVHNNSSSLPMIVADQVNYQQATLKVWVTCCWAHKLIWNVNCETVSHKLALYYIYSQFIQCIVLLHEDAMQNLALFLRHKNNKYGEGLRTDCPVQSQMSVQQMEGG